MRQKIKFGRNSLDIYARQLARFGSAATARNLDGLVAVGLDLEPATLLCAYSVGMFPWYSQGEPILWWSPDPRCVLKLDNFHLPARSARAIASKKFRFTFNHSFASTVRACAAPRKQQKNTWINRDIFCAYVKLHDLGYAHSLETWLDGKMVGGLYGVCLGKFFFGESMFHTISEASRAALAALVTLLRQNGFIAIDCQQTTPHMLRVGAAPMLKLDFLELLAHVLNFDVNPLNLDSDISPWLPWLSKYEYCPEINKWTAMDNTESCTLKQHSVFQGSS